MRIFGRFLFSLYLWTVVVSVTGVVSSLILLSFPLALFDRDRRIAHKLGSLWGILLFKLNPFWRLRIVGREKLRNTQGYVLVANHMSLSDIVCLFTLNHQFKWLAKKTLFQIPFLGWSMGVMRYISLERGQHGSHPNQDREQRRTKGELFIIGVWIPQILRHRKIYGFIPEVTGLDREQASQEDDEAQDGERYPAEFLETAS